MNGLVPLTLTMLANGKKVMSQDCNMYTRDWAAFQAREDVHTTCSMDGKHTVAVLAQTTPEGLCTVMVYHTR